jgi:rare lipoprotein A
MQVMSHLWKRTQNAGACAPEGQPKVGEPYTVDGVRYTPAASSYGYREKGIASWYGDDFHGKATADGECYNMYAYTAAHKTLPLPTVVRVTNLENGKSVVVKVNDRGPFLRGRLIDLSYAAAQSLDIVRAGSAPVLVEAIGGPFYKNQGSVFAGQGQAPAEVAPLGTPETEEANLPPAIPAGVTAEVSPAAMPQALPPPPVAPVAATRPLLRTQVYVQVGAFAEVGRADSVTAALKAVEPTASQYRLEVGGRTLYRVRSGPYANVAEAEAALNKLAAAFPAAKIVVEN